MPTMSLSETATLGLDAGRNDRVPQTPTSITLSQAICKYFRIFRASLIERMVYRADFLLGTVLRFLPMITTILLWQAIYKGSGKGEIAGFSFHEMIAYLLLVHISRMFSSMPGLAVSIARDIRDGSLKKYLVQPLHMLGYLTAYRMAHKVAYISMSAVPYGLLFLLCYEYFDGFPGLEILAGYVISLVLAFFIGFYFEATIGMIGFWFLEVTSFLYVINTLNFFVSGHMFPIDLLPAPWPHLLKLLPFQYLAFFPAMVFLGKIKGMALVYGLLAELGWAVVLVVLANVLYRLGLRRYSAYGG
jgi:ABC-2 type transport system permease protein